MSGADTHSFSTKSTAGAPGSRFRAAIATALATVLCAVSMFVATPSPAAASIDDPVFGLWMVESGKAIVRIDDCGDGGLCGSLVWLSEPRDGSGALKKDLANPDPAKRRATLCGLSFMSASMRERPGEWRGGRIYSARDGKIYSVDLESVNSATLKVRGYLGLPLFGRSQEWTRVSHDRGGC